MEFTESQAKRLTELGVDVTTNPKIYSSAAARDKDFHAIEKAMVAQARDTLDHYREIKRRPELLLLQNRIEQALVQAGFAQVTTPTIISKKQLEKMSIDAAHPLTAQVFWLDNKRCLRPMLAPNLYDISIDLMRIWSPPVRVFEIGACFRKESQGARHLNEFTMCNLVEWGLPLEQRAERIRQLAEIVMQAAGIDDYTYETTNSEVYGESIDVVQGETELASSSMGPHVLDSAWGIDSSWVGIGFGLERLLMTRDQMHNIHSVGKSLSYLDGVRLKIQ